VPKNKSSTPEVADYSIVEFMRLQRFFFHKRPTSDDVKFWFSVRKECDPKEHGM